MRRSTTPASSSSTSPARTSTRRAAPSSRRSSPPSAPAESRSSPRTTSATSRSRTRGWPSHEHPRGPALPRGDGGREARRADRVAHEDEDREREEEERVYGDARAPLGEEVAPHDRHRRAEERDLGGVHERASLSSASARSRRSFEAMIAIPRERWEATTFWTTARPASSRFAPS